MDDDNILGFNFWPAFADLMLSLVLVMAIVVFVISAVINASTVNLSNVDKSQQEIVETIKAAARNDYRVSSEPGSNEDIIIINDLDRQKITFSEHVLFQPDRYQLTPRGEQALRIVGNALNDRIELIREIQIQGHADIDKTTKYKQFGNMELAAYRSLAVFAFLQKDIGIDPAHHMMSATSFGEFKPVGRNEADATYSQKRLVQDNTTKEQKNRNRRIELLIFYRK